MKVHTSGGEDCCARTNSRVVYGDDMSMGVQFISRDSSNIGALCGGIQDVFISDVVVYFIDATA